MSMDRCNKCGEPIDTDFDVECYVKETPADKDFTCWCASCRENHQAAEDGSQFGLGA